ncbi:hypothetical protein GBF38_010748 [Nibea albiflora]|uniref:Uncharacterized protein n=1 Tax=Nibea albiflora TaxID=240163 RepID=A0ACB7ES98_NIBAL|nr:hypothetical protein GBF38_010748 [Nibea albiflora]
MPADRTLLAVMMGNPFWHESAFWIGGSSAVCSAPCGSRRGENSAVKFVDDTTAAITNNEEEINNNLLLNLS